jgi:hypothetical protein
LIILKEEDLEWILQNDHDEDVEYLCEDSHNEEARIFYDVPLKTLKICSNR